MFVRCIGAVWIGKIEIDHGSFSWFLDLWVTCVELYLHPFCHSWSIRMLFESDDLDGSWNVYAMLDWDFYAFNLLAVSNTRKYLFKSLINASDFVKILLSVITTYLLIFHTCLSSFISLLLQIVDLMHIISSQHEYVHDVSYCSCRNLSSSSAIWCILCSRFSRDNLLRFNRVNRKPS